MMDGGIPVSAMDSGTGGMAGASPDSGVTIRSIRELTSLGSLWTEKKHDGSALFYIGRNPAHTMPAAILVLFALLVPETTEIEFVTTDLPWAIAEKGYEAPPLEVRVSGSCPHGGVGYAVVSGALPPGIQLSRLGYFSGAPLHTGEFKFTIRASDGCGWAAKQFTLVVTGAPMITVTPMHVSFECRAGETPPEQRVRVSATWPRLAYRLTT